MSAPSWYLIAYDVRDPKRLRRVQRYLRTCAYALQESVFAWQGNQRQLAELKQQLTRLIRQSEDDVRGYPVPDGQAILWWGNSPMPLGIVDECAPPIDLQGAPTQDG